MQHYEKLVWVSSPAFVPGGDFLQNQIDTVIKCCGNNLYLAGYVFIVEQMLISVCKWYML